ncbi:MAG TPA: methyltransferase domain-containing protein [Prolixibacteraceae bacterium]|nr:methyltransferase domain-containing protein [Prolixibacteraceae bacterium]
MSVLFDDPMGRAVYDYHFNAVNQPIIVHSSDFDDDILDTGYLFRSYKEMPALEKKALSLCKGSVLDVGACAGAHSLFLQKKGFEVTALEVSSLCCEVLKARNIRQVVNQDIMQFNSQKFDTILLLMNGTGIAGTLAGLDILLHHLRSLLLPEGQILIDSSDLIYLYEQEDGSALIDINADNYYGELVFQTEYKGYISQPFPWLYVDINNLEGALEKNQLKLSNIYKGQHYDYLARITF